MFRREEIAYQMGASTSNASIGEDGEEFSRWRRTFVEALAQKDRLIMCIFGSWRRMKNRRRIG
jgi:hypothetical protein